MQQQRTPKPWTPFRDAIWEQSVIELLNELLPLVLNNVIIEYTALAPSFYGKFLTQWRLSIKDSQPFSIAFDDENLYISDFGNSIATYDLEGNFIRPFSTSISHEDTWSPLGIEIVNNYLFIIQVQAMLIIEMKSNQIIQQWSLPKLLDYTYGRYFKVDQDRIYFTLYRSHYIYLYNHNGNEIKKFGNQEESDKQGKFNEPQGLTIDYRYLYICDENNHRIQVVNKANGVFIRQWGQYGIQDRGEFCFPTGLLLYNDLIYVGDRYRVQVFTREGEFVHYIGTENAGQAKREGEFCSVTGFCVVKDRLYVADRDNHRIQVFI